MELKEYGWGSGCDVWAAGCVIWELYSGSALFHANEDDDHLRDIEDFIGIQIPSHMRYESAEGRDEGSKSAKRRSPLQVILEEHSLRGAEVFLCSTPANRSRHAHLFCRGLAPSLSSQLLTVNKSL